MARGIFRGHLKKWEPGRGPGCGSVITGGAGSLPRLHEVEERDRGEEDRQRSAPAGTAPSKRIKPPLSGSLPALPRGERGHLSASGNAFASLNAYAKRTDHEMRPIPRSAIRHRLHGTPASAGRGAVYAVALPRERGVPFRIGRLNRWRCGVARDFPRASRPCAGLGFRLQAAPGECRPLPRKRGTPNLVTCHMTPVTFVSIGGSIITRMELNSLPHGGNLSAFGFLTSLNQPATGTTST